MINRITTQMSMQSAQARLQSGAVKLAKLQEQATSLSNITKPSDDPTGTSQSMQVRSEQAANAQYSRNASNAGGWLATTDSALSSVYSVVSKIRDLTVQGANDGALDQSSRDAIATQLTALKQDLLADANTKYAGRSVFAGNSDASSAYADDFTPNSTATTGVDRRIADGTTVRVDTDGSAVFGSGDTSVFALVDSIVSDLQKGVNVNPRLTEIDSRIDAIRGAQGDVGTRHASVLTAQSTLTAKSTDLEGQRSSIEDKDVAKAVLDLQLQNTNYQAALAVTAKVLQPTLMDYLR